MRTARLLTLTAAALAGTAGACSKEEYAANFGDAYELLPTPEPHLEGTNVVAHVRYLTKCSGSGGSTFVAKTKDTGSFDAFDVVLLERVANTACAAPFETSVVEEVRVPLPSFENGGGLAGKDLFVAFPPDGHYELYKLADKEDRPRSLAAIPMQAEEGVEVQVEVEAGVQVQVEAEAGVDAAGPERAGAIDAVRRLEIQNELATHTPEDTVNFLEHCLSEHKTPCCENGMIEALKEKIADDQARLVGTSAKDDANASSDSSAATAADIGTSVGASLTEILS